MPVVQIGGASAAVLFAGLVFTRLYQFNVVVPVSAPNWDGAITAAYNGLSVQPGVLITCSERV